MSDYARIKREIDRLRDVRPNWDGRGAKAPIPAALADAERIAERFFGSFNRYSFVTSGYDGVVQIEWTSRDKARTVELELHGDSRASVLRGEGAAAVDVDIDLGDLSVLGPHLDWVNSERGSDERQD